ncbi:MAG: hypothetical protein KF862_03570 [Chitinophagaceae bacterium]|nr:hypothetical protein [Chitinophagaceae bacterium]
MEWQGSRRLFLKRGIVFGLTFAGVGALIQGCGQSPAGGDAQKENKAASAADPCSDYTGLTEDDIKARQHLGYVEVSPVSDRQCSNCNLWLPPPAGNPCGKCQLFKGPVEPGGHCTYWAPLAQQAG